MMNLRWSSLLVCACMVSTSMVAQVLDDGIGNYRLTGGAGLPGSFTIGDSYFTTGSAFNIRGDQMGTPTGEVLLTDAPTGTTTNWRLLRGGTEYGRFSSQHSNDDLTLNAVVQDMRFLSSNTYRMRLSGTYTGQVVNGYAGLDLSGYLGVSMLTVSGTLRSPAMPSS